MKSSLKWLDQTAIFVPPHRTTTAHLQAVFPLMSSPGIGSNGTYIGREFAGGSFCYDPWELYARGVLTNPNILVIGQVGRGKSSLVKSLLVRQQVFGRKAAVLDPKGEYQGLASALGATVLKIEPGGKLRLNPLDPGLSYGEVEGDEIFRRQTSLLQALSESSLGRQLRPEERTACDLALGDLTYGKLGRVVTIPDVVEWLLNPDPAACQSVNATAEQVAAAVRDVALELRRMCFGDLKGMFDGPTNVNIDWNGNLVVIDLSAVFSSSALGLLMTCATAFLQSAIMRPNAGRRFIVVDEAWAVMNNIGVARWLQQTYKLSRAYGISNIAVMHRVSDLQSSGSQGSEAHSLAKGLLADTETRIIYGQPHSEVELAKEMLGLNEAEADLLPALGRGQALWKVGQRAFLVEHILGMSEKNIVDTDASM